MGKYFHFVSSRNTAEISCALHVMSRVRQYPGSNQTNWLLPLSNIKKNKNKQTKQNKHTKNRPARSDTLILNHYVTSYKSYRQFRLNWRVLHKSLNWLDHVSFQLATSDMDWSYLFISLPFFYNIYVKSCFGVEEEFRSFKEQEEGGRRGVDKAVEELTLDFIINTIGLC